MRQLLTLHNVGLLLVLATFMMGMKSSCRSSSQTASVPSVNTKNVNAEKSESGMLELKLTSEKSSLSAGQCSDLNLTVHNSSTSPIIWKKDWVFEQEGSTSPLPESFPRSDVELPAGTTTKVVTIRLCYKDLKPGTYRYRISTSSTRSNQVSIEVVRSL